MKQPSLEVQKKLLNLNKPYKRFEGVDYDSIIKLRLPCVKIDSKNEQESTRGKRNMNSGKSSKVSHDGDQSQEVEEEDNQNSQVCVCGLIIDINSITKKDILKLRKYMPKKEYM